MASIGKAETPPVALPTKVTRPPRKSAAVRRRQQAGILFVLPSMAFVVLFFLIPLVMTAFMSLSDWPLLGTPSFIGLGNYQTLLTDKLFWQSLLFTTKYTVVITPIIMVVSFGLALLAKQRVPGVGFFRTAFFLPVVVGMSTSAILWKQMFNDQVGVFDGMLMGLHLIKDPIIWLADPTKALIAICVMVVWKVAGATMLFFMVGMNAIPDEFYEAARVDGANWWRRLVHITLPLLRRTFALAIILSVIGSYLAFDQFYIITQGGPENQTITTVYWIYNTSFVNFKLGYGAALSFVLLAVLIILSIGQLYLLRDTSQ